jgi:hypothetical protein
MTDYGMNWSRPGLMRLIACALALPVFQRELPTVF